MLPQILTVTIMAFAVSMDAFSIALGMGMYKLRLRQIFRIGLTVGVFHIMMPLLGILAGNLLSGIFGQITVYVGGVLLLIIGLQMTVYAFKKEENTMIVPVGTGMFVFGLLVSLDSFSAGLSLGMFGAKALAAVIAFGGISTLLTWLGMLLGRKIQGYMGMYGEILGGCILILFGIKLIMTL